MTAASLRAGTKIDTRGVSDGVLGLKRGKISVLSRALSRGQSDTAEAAGLFYYLNRTGYNGLCRFNTSGGFNVPFGANVELGRGFSLQPM